MDRKWFMCRRILQNCRADGIAGLIARFLILDLLHLLNTGASDRLWRHVMIPNQIVLHYLNIFMLNDTFTENNSRSALSISRGRGEIFVQEARLLNNVTEVDEAWIRHDLIHVIDTRAELVILAKRLNLVVVDPLSVGKDVFFVALGVLGAKLTLNDVRKRIRQL